MGHRFAVGRKGSPITVYYPSDVPKEEQSRFYFRSWDVGEMLDWQERQKQAKTDEERVALMLDLMPRLSLGWDDVQDVNGAPLIYESGESLKQLPANDVADIWELLIDALLPKVRKAPSPDEKPELRVVPRDEPPPDPDSAAALLAGGTKEAAETLEPVGAPTDPNS